MKLLLASMLLLAGIKTQTFAQTENRTDAKASFSIEIDPATFVWNGFSIHARFQPKNSRHLLVGAGAYGLDLPDFLVDLNPKNASQGWEVRINQGLSAFGEYHFSEVNRKWFVGTQIGVQTFEIENSDVSGSNQFNNLLAMGYVGYTVKPFGDKLYFKPWAGVGYTSKIAGENRLAHLEYNIQPITMFLTLHVGYTF